MIGKPNSLHRQRPWLRTAVCGGIAALICVLVTADVAWACPTCKENLANSGPAAMNLIRGYFWSILFMMSMPFLILGGLASYFYYEVRKARARQAATNVAVPANLPAGSW